MNSAAIAKERVPLPHGNRYQRYFMLFGVFFVLSLLGSILYRSMSRPSSVGGSTATPSTLASSSQLHLQEFNRVQVKDGRPVWEIQARDAKYFTSENLTQVSNPSLLVYRLKQAPLALKAKIAKLFLESDSLKRAEVEGAVSVTIDETTTVRTETGVFSAEENTFTAPGRVHIVGQGFVIQGVGMKLHVESEEVSLLSNVSTVFEPGTKTPSEKSSAKKERQ